MNDEKLTADDIACLISGIDKPSECDDCISRQAVLEKQYRIDDSATLSTRDVVNVEDIEEMLSVTPTERTGHWNNHQVACLLAELFGDTCACNYNGIDEWLPEVCDFQDICPRTIGVACWEQFLKHRKEW